jgi:hypothetical protein
LGSSMAVKFRDRADRKRRARVNNCLPIKAKGIKG